MTVRVPAKSSALTMAIVFVVGLAASSAWCADDDSPNLAPQSVPVAGFAPEPVTPLVDDTTPPAPAARANTAPASIPAAELPGETYQEIQDPLEPFNSALFTFNLKLHDWVLHPVAYGYSRVLPVPARKAVARFFDNVGVLPRFANNLFQLRVPEAGGEAGRFLINTTLGMAGFFDVADPWFGLKEHYQDFGLTLGHYGSGSGPYLMLPFFGPSSLRDTIGLVADGAMNPINYLFPAYIVYSTAAGSNVAQAVNYTSLNLNQFEEANRYAIDLYGAVQDAWVQRRRKQLQQ